MRRWNDGWLHSPRDVLAVLECDHRLQLEHAATARLLPRPSSAGDATLQLVGQHGLAHERAALDALSALAPGRVVQIPSPGTDEGALRRAAALTEAALADQVDVVHQAALLLDEPLGFLGYADFLVSIDPRTGAPLVDEATGRRRYEPVDAKLARTAKPAAVLQAACYADALTTLGHPAPRQVHVWPGTGEVESAAAADLLPLVAEYRERVRHQLAGAPAVPEPAWADARPACGTCAWSEHCDTGRRQARDLSLVAGIRRDQVHRLRERGATTVELLARAADDQRPAGMGRGTFARLRAQAALQVRGAGAAVPVVDVFDPAPLRALPAPDAGDLYYDIEGDPFAEGGSGLEYLHGVTDARGGFTAQWAHSCEQEKAAFEAVVDRFTAAAAAHPGMHVYHYAAYERTALLHLAVRHGTREAQVDQLLRDGRLVDLFAVVRASVRASTESYSIKKLEPLYMGGDLREGDVTNAGDSIVQYERFVAARQAGDDGAAASILAAVEDYNAYDCESTRRLHAWLLAQGGRDAAPAPALAASDDAPAVDADPEPAEVALAARLREGVPGDAGARTPEQHARALIAAALGYYRREHKPFWWEHFERLRTPLDELAADDDVVVLEGVQAGEWHRPPRARSLKRTVTASTTSSAGDVARLGGSPFVVYEAPAPDGLSTSADAARATHERCADLDGCVSFLEAATPGAGGWPQLPVALLPGSPPSTKAKEQVVLALAEQVLAGAASDTAWWRLLLRRAPAGPLPGTGQTAQDLVAALTAMGRDVLAVQGPPGTGKTHVGSSVIAALARRGWRIGVVAQSHSVVANLLGRVLAVDPSLAVAKEPHGDGPVPWQTPARLDAWLDGEAGGCVVGGTSWTFARAGVRAHRLDLVVVEEAGQLALVDTLVAGSAAQRVLLLGDPQQLPQVCTGSHPEPVDVSALRHLLGNAALVPQGAGYLLDTTWRLHADVCAPVSRLQYEGVLRAHPRCATRSLDGVAPGVHLLEVEHRDNRTSSPEEVTAVVARVADLLGRAWTDPAEGTGRTPRPLGQDDVLVVAPFNRQVTALREALAAAGHPDVQVGTVDRFQGREAPVVIVSMATSSGEDLPRGVEFLLSRNRLNVALSRAKWAACLVHSPELRRLTPTSVAGLVALGAFVGVLRGS